MGLRKFDYLLADIPFAIKTDHRNLLYMNYHVSKKVLGWKMEIQAYNFVIMHIPGKYNIIPDDFSRFVLNKKIDNTIENNFLETYISSELEKQCEDETFITFLNNIEVLESDFQKDIGLMETLPNFLPLICLVLKILI